MKDQSMILALDFKNLNLQALRKAMINNGWIIKETSISFKREGFKVTIFESKDDYEWNEKMCSKIDTTYDIAFIECLKEIQKYYLRVKNE